MSGNVLPIRADGRRRWENIEELAEAYRAFLIGEGYAPFSIYVKGRYLRRAVEWMAEHRNTTLDECGPIDVAEFAETLPPSRSSRAQVRGALRDYWAMTDRLRAPVKAIRLPRKPKPVTRALSDSEIRRLLEVAEGDHPRGTAVFLGYFLALRVSEIAKARWDGFDRPRLWYTLISAKGGQQASLPVHPALREQLEVVPVTDEPWMFPGHRGRLHMHPASINNYVHELADVSGVENCYPHRLRHTALARANDILGDLRAVSEFARHSRVETTMGYTRTTAQKLEAVSNSLSFEEDQSEDD